MGGSCGQSCTADLKKVIDCNGNVVLECGPDQGCANGACIDDPCEAAKVSSSSYGCDYWALKTDIISEGLGACYAAFLANTWSSPVKIQVERNGQALPVEAFDNTFARRIAEEQALPFPLGIINAVPLGKMPKELDAAPGK